MPEAGIRRDKNRPGAAGRRPSHRRWATRLIEAALWATAFGCASYCMLMYARSRSMLEVPVPAAISGGDSGASRPPSGALIGRLTIPGIQLSVPVLEDDQAESLTRGVGHIPSTAMPGGLGTVGLAGHRDTFLRPLSRITPKMEIFLSSSGGTYRYVVDSTEIVLPEAVRVLEIVDQPALVIVTCYPFHYIGAAPKRFIVHAHLVSLLPG
jgi:sortase A